MNTLDVITLVAAVVGIISTAISVATLLRQNLKKSEGERTKKDYALPAILVISVVLLATMTSMFALQRKKNINLVDIQHRATAEMQAWRQNYADGNQISAQYIDFYEISGIVSGGQTLLDSIQDCSPALFTRGTAINNRLQSLLPAVSSPVSTEQKDALLGEAMAMVAIVESISSNGLPRCTNG